MSHLPTFNRLFGGLFRFFFPKRGINDPSRVEDGWSPDGVSRFRKWLHRGIAIIVVPLGIAMIIWSVLLGHYSRQLSNRLEELREKKLLVTARDLLPPPVPDEFNAYIPLAEICSLSETAFYQDISQELDIISKYLRAEPIHKRGLFINLPEALKSMNEEEMRHYYYNLAFSPEINSLIFRINQEMALPGFDPYYEYQNNPDFSFELYEHVHNHYYRISSKLKRLYMHRLQGAQFINDPDIIVSTLVSNIRYEEKTSITYESSDILMAAAYMSRPILYLPAFIQHNIFSETHYLELLMLLQHINQLRINTINEVWLSYNKNYILLMNINLNEYRKNKLSIRPIFTFTKKTNTLKLYFLTPFIYRDFGVCLNPDFYTLNPDITLNDAIHIIQSSIRSHVSESTKSFFPTPLIDTLIQDADPIVRYVSMLSRRNTAIIGLALEIHRIRTGAYPDSLNALVPGILDSIPDDPFTNENYKYAKTGDSITISLPDSVTVLSDEQKKKSVWEITR